MVLSQFAAVGISDEVAIAIVSTIGGIVISYITYVGAKKYTSKRAEKQPKDRMEQMFDGYERLIRAKDIEDERKTKLILVLEESVSKLEEELTVTKTALNTTKEQLVESRRETKNLRVQLEKIRREYKKTKSK